MEAFPCPVERTVASALLLLSASPPLPTESKRSCAESLVSSNSKSSSSSVTSDDGSSAEFRDYGLRFFTVVAPFHQMKLKVVRKSRSKNFQSPGRWKMMPSKPAMKTSESPSVTTEASSCLSSSSSAISSARDCNFTRIGKREALARDLKKKPVSSAIIRRRAEAILKLLSNGCASEVRIRQLLGDSPDTSKALRM
ncbi:hypothetical protein F0562_015645 [Nyssa sinensis]|uniref:HTH three-helical bundle domain-containing protein n=1 Tax=Nyssa sinensis TaxID=561372 RepID=A0A5J4ZM63_9ASTE|nr:hypothetical protein F0562_015645 [Nyssa sinensis]